MASGEPAAGKAAEQPGVGGTPAAEAASAAPPREERKAEARLLIRSYPKAVFFYPTALAGLVCGLFTALGWAEAHTLGFVFMAVFLCNLVIVAFEFTRHVTVALVLGILVLVLLAALLKEQIGLKDLLVRLYRGLDFQANAPFYFGICTCYVLVMLGVLVDTRFDYWEIRGNEVLHHHGFLGDVERFPAPNIKLRKEITDVFEHLLLGSGTLVIFPGPGERPIVLENVPRINKLEDEITRRLHALQVKIDKD